MEKRNNTHILSRLLDQDHCLINFIIKKSQFLLFRCKDSSKFIICFLRKINNDILLNYYSYIVKFTMSHYTQFK